MCHFSPETATAFVLKKMRFARFCSFCAIFMTVLNVVVLSRVARVDSRREAKKNKCLNPPRTARRVESVIAECQEEIKTKLVYEAYEIMREEVNKGTISTENSSRLPQDETLGTHGRLLHRKRRGGAIASTIYNPTLVPNEDKRIAGCLLHCVYAKNNAIDGLGWPTLDGLVDFYSEGVSEHGYFMATLRSVNICLRAITNKYRVDRRMPPEKGQSCDLSFDVFDCISDQITGYCLDQYKQ